MQIELGIDEDLENRRDMPQTVNAHASVATKTRLFRLDF